MKYPILVILVLLSISLQAQPEPCGTVPVMANRCVDACVICDIDGYTGTNDLQAGGQWPGSTFCSTPHDMHYIAFIAGSESLSIQISVSNCQTSGGWRSIDLGFFRSDDCENFTPITTCKEDLEGGDSFVFNTFEPLVIGQHYYLIMDGTNGSICDWTFDVKSGSTKVLDLTSSGEIEMPEEVCPNMPIGIRTTGEEGASLYFWTVNGENISGVDQEFVYEFSEDGIYEVCVIAANPCDEGPATCNFINVRTPGTKDLVEVLCDGECTEINGVEYCNSGFFYGNRQITKWL